MSVLTHPGHAPGWRWRKPYAGQMPHAWGDLPQRVGGLCEKGWHSDCPQSPGVEPGEPGTCGCPCHLDGQQLLPLDVLR